MVAQSTDTNRYPAKAREFHNKPLSEFAEWAPKKGIKWGIVFRHAILITFTLAILLPLFWVFIRSIISLPDGTKNAILPQHWSDPIYKHYQWIYEKRPDARTAFKNSVYVSLLTVILTTVTAVLAGYALSHLSTPFKRVITAILVASLFFPTRVTAITGIYEVQKSLGFINKTWALTFPYAALNVAVCVFIMRGVFETISKEIVDAARVDGASSLRLLLGILVPIIKNGIVVVVIVSFVAAWGEFLLALTLMNDA
ncbi:MAG TPA: carbohydrate ABC transporter permease, partial [Thermomicrobiales bacterium]|nr:carbohydrate ABC transporter permease [Thermomicrobiales bacterium]